MRRAWLRELYLPGALAAFAAFQRPFRPQPLEWDSALTAL